MEKCWSKSAGGCGTKLSREHFVSQSLWPESSIDVVGLKWCRDAPKKVGMGSLTAKILCDSHNNGFSDIDSSAGNAFNTMRRTMALNRERSASRARKWKVVRYEIDGPMLERWFLKTALNVACLQESDEVWRLDKSPLTSPGPALVSLALGKQRLTSPMGLYMGAQAGLDLQFQDAFEAGPLYYFNEGVIGFLFVFHGLPFLLWLADPGPPSPLPIPWNRGGTAHARDLHRHLRYVRWQVGRHISHYVDFLWPDQPTASWVGAL